MGTRDTICALASGTPPSAIAVVRVSGPAVRQVCEQLLASGLAEPRRAVLTRITDSKGAEVDQGLALFSPAPHSYTGEDTLELFLHGGLAVITHVLEALTALPGVRLAGPGEFTRRAFEGGKLDLTEAEGVADLIEEGEAHSRPVNDLFGLMATLNRLERVIHQAKNVCEETLFVVIGESKDDKVFEILFLDERNEGASQLAEQVARKAFPESGHYRSAGWDPAQRVDPAYVGFGDQNGFDLRDVWPASVHALVAHLEEFNIIVDMDGRGRAQLGNVPFHTVVVRWDVDTGSGPATVHKQVAPRIGELMERLRGQTAR